MHQIVAALVVLISVVAPQAMAQQDQPRYVNEAFYRISFADLDEWNRMYWEYAVPVLEQLRQERLIEGWSASSHQTGGTYNYRLAWRFYDWASILPAYEAYFARLNEVAPPGTQEKFGKMIMAHRDEIWLIADAHPPAEGSPATRYLYNSAFQVSQGEMEEWNRLYEEVLTPVLSGMVSDGMLNGWVVLNHRFGGPDNWKILYFCEDWDSMDDFFDQYFARIGERDPAALDKLGQLIVSHHDNLWQPVAAEEAADDM